MKEVTMFYLENCPHCKKARVLMEDLFTSRPELRNVPLQMVEESKEPKKAGEYDYYYVPTYYVGDEKIHEGVPTAEAIEKVFTLAAE